MKNFPFPYMVLPLVLLGGCATPNGARIIEWAKQEAQLPATTELDFECNEECNLVYREIEADDGSNFYIKLDRDCALGADAACLWNVEFIRLFRPKSASRSWEFRGRQYERAAHGVDDGLPYEIIEERLDGELERTYILTDDRVLMVAHVDELCAGGLCIVVAHRNAILYEIFLHRSPESPT